MESPLARASSSIPHISTKRLLHATISPWGSTAMMPSRVDSMVAESSELAAAVACLDSRRSDTIRVFSRATAAPLASPCSSAPSSSSNSLPPLLWSSNRQRTSPELPSTGTVIRLVAGGCEPGYMPWGAQPSLSMKISLLPRTLPAEPPPPAGRWTGRISPCSSSTVTATSPFCTRPALPPEAPVSSAAERIRVLSTARSSRTAFS